MCNLSLHEFLGMLRTLNEVAAHVLHHAFVPFMHIDKPSGGFSLSVDCADCSGSEDFETLALPENSPQRKVQAQQQPSGLTVGDKRSLEAVETTGWETVSLHKHKLLYRAPEVLTGAKCDSKVRPITSYLQY